jgi:hypothetical protein
VKHADGAFDKVQFVLEKGNLGEGLQAKEVTMLIDKGKSSVEVKAGKVLEVSK